MPTAPRAAGPQCLHPQQPLEVGTVQSSPLYLMDIQMPWDRGFCRWLQADCAYGAPSRREVGEASIRPLSQGDMRPGFILGQP